MVRPSLNFTFSWLITFAVSFSAHASSCGDGFSIIAGPREDPQLKIWALESKGKKTAATKLKAKTAHDLKNAEVLERVEVDESIGARNRPLFLELAGGVRGVWKKANKKTLKETIAYRFDQALGANMIPLTVERKLDGVPGVIQTFVRETDGAELTYSPETLKLLDFLMGHFDRQPVNYLTAKGRVIAIDNENTFIVSPPRGEIPEFGKFIIEQLRKVEAAGDTAAAKAKAVAQIAPTLISRDVVDKLKTITDAEWKTHLEGLSAAELKSFFKRRDEAVKAIRLAEEKLGDAMYPTGAFSGRNRDPWPGALNRLESALARDLSPAVRYRFERASRLIERESLLDEHLTPVERIRVQDALQELSEQP